MPGTVGALPRSAGCRNIVTMEWDAAHGLRDLWRDRRHEDGTIKRTRKAAMRFMAAQLCMVYSGGRLCLGGL